MLVARTVGDVGGPWYVPAAGPAGAGAGGENTVEFEVGVGVLAGSARKCDEYSTCT